MIRDIKNDILPAMVGASPKGPRSTEQGPKPDAKGLGGRKSFADQLMDAQTDRVEKGGRDDTPKLQGKGIKGKDPDDSPKLRSSTDAKRKMKKEQKADVDDAENLRSQSGAGSEGRMNLKEKSPEKSDSAQTARETVQESAAERKGVAKREDGADRFRTEAPKASPSEGPARIVSVRTSGEVGAVDDADMAQMLEQFGQEQSGVKQQAMAQFMARMQNEFGIEPGKILEAFGKMDAQSLMAPPEETMKQFLNNLELKPEQIEKAQELYQEMVQVTGEAELNEKLAVLGAAEVEGVNLEILSPQERALKQLNEGIDQLNSAFFKNGQGVGPQGQMSTEKMSAEKMDAEVARLARMKNAKNEKAGVDAGLLAPAAAAFSGSSAAAASSSSALDSSAGAVASLSGPDENFSSLGIGGDSFSMMGSDNALSGFNGSNGEAAQGDIGGDAGSSAGQGSGSQMTSMNSAQKEMAEALKAADAGKTAKKTSSSGAQGEKPLGDVSTASVNAGAPFATSAPSGMPGAVGASAGPSAMIIEGPKPTPQDEAENIRELIKQAQFMVKKGGGEMKLQMSPEGMGQVHLKVAVENGQVNVQMLTDNDASKKLLEDGLHELKASLAAQKLHVESMKVNLGSEIQKHMDQQAQQDASREQARQFAQDFMGQFRDERQGFRQGVLDNPGWKSYGRGQGRAPVEPETVTASSQSRNSKNADGSKRLNLVA